MSKNTISASATGLPSRRLFLAAGSAATVFGAISAAAHGTEASDLLSLIAKHRAAREAFCEAIDLQEATQDRYDEAYPDPVLTPAGPGRSYELTYGYDFCKKGIADDFEEQRKKLSGLVRLDPTAAEQALAAIDAKEVERIATLDVNFAADEARKEAFGLSAANRRWQETNDAERELTIILLAYQCRDIEEARIKVEYVMSSPLKDEIHDEDLLMPLLQSFVRPTLTV
ncbi:hypothetical protein QM467_00590 [Rhodoblastus sp. 17X3]|uniref:hypothetical protein n=1 Tax=Rhodoblastus sp. 17X3 TaxID=3047026 RepID=UPI0024B79057|nr:hypothetical protein [Rhodoblastus sp. 17X3]MDI9846548.1 hypothetical protein [Rhodoblastus sp. 17X3]